MPPAGDVKAPGEAWAEAGRRLLELDPQRFIRLLAIAEGYVVAYDFTEPEKPLSAEAIVASLYR